MSALIRSTHDGGLYDLLTMIRVCLTGGAACPGDETHLNIKRKDTSRGDIPRAGDLAAKK